MTERRSRSPDEIFWNRSKSNAQTVYLYFRINAGQESVLYLFPFGPKIYLRHCASLANRFIAILTIFLTSIQSIHSAARLYPACRIIVTLRPERDVTQRKANLIFKVAVNHTRRGNNLAYSLTRARARARYSWPKETCSSENGAPSRTASTTPRLASWAARRQVFRYRLPVRPVFVGQVRSSSA